FGNNSLSVEEGLIWAKNHNADVILIEIGSWTYEYLDGSSNAEAIIDQLTAQGIPVIVPAGNLGGAKRHAQKNGSAGSVLTTQFSIPSLTPNITSTYITILTRDSFNNSIQVNITEPTSGGGQIIHQIPLGYGYLNWSYYYGTNLAVRAFISNSSRGTHMIGLDIWGTFRVDNYTVHILSPYSAAYHYYISDDVTSWSGGAQWVDGVNNISTITWPSTADTAISVASYHTRYGYPIAPFGGLASFSPSGPRIDGMPKISVAAPGGNDVISAWANNSGYIPLYKNFGGYTLFGGTSAAGPHVAGAVAILLQLDPNCGANAKSILEVTAYPDWMVPRPLPDSQWGYGKLSVLAAILNVSDIPVITNISRSLNIPKDYETVNVTTTINKIVLGTVTPLLIQLNWTTDNWITCSVSAPTPSPSFCKIEHTIPAYPNGTTVQYKVNITGYGWSRMSTIYGYTVADYLDPTVNDLYTNPETVHANAPFRIYASFSDDGGIATAILSFNSNGTWINASMTSQNLTLCYVDLTVNEVGNMSVRVYASDFNGHWVAEDMPDIVVNPPSSTASTTSPTSPTSTSPTSPTSSTPSTSSGWLFVIALSSVALLVIIKRVKRKVKRD
ncbi:MAG: S8 family serine peptidase, partial [Candidatus Hodarchaeota archaeon]